MIHAFKVARSLQPSTAAAFACSAPLCLGHKASSVKFATTMTSNPPGSQLKMDDTENPNAKTGDVMSHSLGEGYATRSDEEGFGGIYGENQSLQKDQDIHENHPAYDKTQGSEVKEKETARNQKEANK